MDLSWVPALIGGLGIGSLANSFLTRRSSLKDRWYQEKREAYLGLLQALHDAAIRPSDENSKAFALWQTRCEVFGSSDVTKYAQLMKDTNEGPRTDRDAAFRGLIDAIKRDLKT